MNGKDFILAIHNIFSDVTKSFFKVKVLFSSMLTEIFLTSQILSWPSANFVLLFKTDQVMPPSPPTHTPTPTPWPL